MGQQLDKASRLAMVASEGQVKQVKRLSLAGTGDMNIRDEDGRTALMLAVQHGHVVAVRTLIEAGADVNAKELTHTSRRSILMMAVEAGSVDCVKALLEGKARTDGVDSSGQSCVMLAVRRGHLDCLRALIKAGADLNRGASLGKTPLMVAMERGDVKCVEMLLQAGADPDLSDDGGQTCLMMAAAESKPQGEKWLEMLLQNRANPNLGDKNGMTAAMFCVKRANLRGLERLLKARADPDIRDSLGRTSLMYAAQPGSVSIELQKDLIKALVDAGADVNIRDYDGTTALMHTLSSHPHVPPTQLVKITGTDVNIADRNGVTVLSLGIERISDNTVFLQFLHYLMESDVNLDATDRWGKTALIHALEAKDPNHEKAVALLQKGANPHTEQHQHLTMVKCSPLICCSLQKNFERGAPERYEFAKFFIASSFLTNFDARYRPGSDILRDELDEGSRSLLYELYSQPWPLVKLAFVAASSVLGPNPGREERVKQTQLPQRVQNLLLFQDSISRLPRHHWANIQFCFNPAQYNQLPKPRPLLFHWPFGREVVKCYCKKCQGRGLNFHGV